MGRARWVLAMMNWLVPLGALALAVGSVYAQMVTADLGKHGRQFVAGCVRTFKARPGRVQFPQLGMDVQDPDVLHRLDCKSIRPLNRLAEAVGSNGVKRWHLVTLV